MAAKPPAKSLSKTPIKTTTIAKPDLNLKYIGKHITLQAECSVSTLAKESHVHLRGDSNTMIAGNKTETISGKYVLHTPELELDTKLLLKRPFTGTILLQNRQGGDTVGSSTWLPVPLDSITSTGTIGIVPSLEHEIMVQEAGIFNFQAYVSFYSSESFPFAVARISINGEGIFQGNPVHGNGISHILGSRALSVDDIVRLEYYSTITTKYGLGRVVPIECVFSSILITKLV